MAEGLIFIDTGAFYARYRPTDTWHEAAKRGWSELEQSTSMLATTDLVIAESANLLGHLIGTVRAAERVRHWLSSKRLTILRPDAADESEAVTLMVKYANQRVGFTDCVSFVMMRRHGIQRVFGFDQHFTYAGFELWPES